MKEWYCYSQGQQHGPMGKDELRSRIQSGQVSANDQIWAEGMDDWKPARDVPEFSGLVGQAPPQSAPAPAQNAYQPNNAYQAPSAQYTYMEKHRGETILVLGILGLVVCQILGIVAWVMGNTDLQKMGAGQMDPSGRSMTKAGRICGMIALVLLILNIVFGCILFIAVAGMEGM